MGKKKPKHSHSDPLGRNAALKMLLGWESEPQKRDEWNRLRSEFPAWYPLLGSAILAGSNLSGANLEGVNLVEADLRQADLRGARLRGADLARAELSRSSLADADLGHSSLNHAQLQRADLSHADISGASIKNADCDHANMFDTNLRGADLRGATLQGADLAAADLTVANLEGTNLADVNFSGARLCGVRLSGARLSGVLFNGTVLTMLALLEMHDVVDLEKCFFRGPSSIDTHTVKAAKGRLPDAFLRGIGMETWEVELARLYDPAIKGSSFVDRLYKIYDMREKGPIGGVFISYSHANGAFVETIESAIKEKDVNVWRDVHDLRAGPLVSQIVDAIRRNDVVLLVMSEAAMASDWIEFEIERARAREKSEDRVILCPVCIDDSWKTARASKPQVAQLARDRVILAFDPRKPLDAGTNAENFRKLIEGMKIFYHPSDPG